MSSHGEYRKPNYVPHEAWCAVHAKKGFRSRKDAKKAIRAMREPGMSAFPCDVLEGLWHIGHLAKAVIQGQLTRDQIAPPRRRT